jgi:hypothetical protein
MSSPIDTSDYCRAVERYLCQKNDGHLIRVVGPSFDVVSSWSDRGVPLKVAFRGIDRYFERYYAKGTRRRPVRIDFCEAEVLDAYDEWKRSVGLVVEQPAVGSRQSAVSSQQSAVGSRQSLPEHLERVLLRLTSARAGGGVDASFDALIDHVARELDSVRASARNVRGDARRAVIDRLAGLDRELLGAAREMLDGTARESIAREADEELVAYRSSMSGEVYARTREAAIDALVRDRFRLPTIAFV